MTAQATVESIIASATTAAQTALQQAITYANQAQTAASGFSSSGTPPAVTEPEVVIPYFDPTTDFTGDFLSAYNDAIADWDPDFQSQITSFINKFFPNMTGCLKTAVDSWICTVLQTGGTGMQPAVENAIWQRDRERVILDARRAEDEAATGWAARGWALPGGVLIDNIQRVQQAASDKNSGHSRDVMIEQAKIEIENIRFAVDQGVKLRLGVISGLLDYLKTWASLRELAIKKGEALLEAKTKLYQTIGAYYSAIVGAARLMLEYDRMRVDAFVSLSDIDMRGFAERLKARVDAAISAAETMGKIAGAGLSAQSTIAEVSHNTQGQDE